MVDDRSQIHQDETFKSHAFLGLVQAQPAPLPKLRKLTPAAKAYWMAELQTHAAAYHRFLVPFLYCSLDRDNKRSKLVISALGRTKSFKAADRLINKAPRLAAWDFMALMPAAGGGGYGGGVGGCRS